MKLITQALMFLALMVCVHTSFATATMQGGKASPKPGTVVNSWTTGESPQQSGKYPQRTTHEVSDADGNSMLVFVGHSYVAAYRPASGMVWSYMKGGSPDGASVVDEKTNLLIFTSPNWEKQEPNLNSIVALDYRNGTVVWSERVSSSEYYIKPQLQVANIPAYPQQRVLFAISGSSIELYGAATGNILQSYNTEALAFCVAGSTNLLVSLVKSPSTKDSIAFNVFDMATTSRFPVYAVDPIQDASLTWDTMKPAVHCTAIAAYKLNVFVAGNKPSTGKYTYTELVMQKFLLEKSSSTLVSTTTLHKSGCVATTDLEQSRALSMSAIVKAPSVVSGVFHINTVNYGASSSQNQGELLAISIDTGAIDYKLSLSTPTEMLACLFMSRSASNTLSVAAVYNATDKTGAFVKYLHVGPLGTIGAVDEKQQEPQQNYFSSSAASFLVEIPSVPTWNQQFLSVPAAVGDTVATLIEDQMIVQPKQTASIYFTFFQL